ncbi:topoisomerase [Viridibacillus sp. YIM B01967]|uniref:Topoisomerase n=1 Tax=Viridibacillus soli TaxID=2798301 RepID=A0ABS1H2L3_9BACL|nr:topoisomerase [Viridibacillus soli]
MKKAIISGIVLISILLVGCNGEPEVLDDSKNGENDTNLLSELKNEIIVSITKQTEIDSESIAIMLGGNPVKGIIDVSVSFPKDVKVDDTMIQQLVEDSIKKVSETENVTISKEDIAIKIEKY